MPGRILNFVTRPSPHPPSSSTDDFSDPLFPKKKKERNNNYRQRFPSPSRQPSFSSSDRLPSLAMDLLHLNKDKDKDREHRKEKRNSLILNTKRGVSGSRDSIRNAQTSSPGLQATVPIEMDIVIESPPLVFYGNVANSTGALMSGRLKLVVRTPEVTFKEIKMTLKSVVTVSKPVDKHCKDCQVQKQDIRSWDFITEPLKVLAGCHELPFSHLFGGHLPATTEMSLAKIEYRLSAYAITDTLEWVDFVYPIKVQRAIVPGADKSSIRIFPPTNLTARVELPSVIHPIGTFPVAMTFSGIVQKREDTQTRWKLRKLVWRVEEHQKAISPACAKHVAKLGGEGKGIEHTNVRTVGSDEHKSGWKTDWDTVGGELIMEFQASLNPSLHPVCDVQSNSGIEVTHNFVIEMVVAEEYCPNKNPKMATPTGAARVLRMQFKMFVTARPGLGVSWDEEMPPVYSDVPASPPTYRNTTIEDYGGPPLDYEELDRLDRNGPTGEISVPDGMTESPHPTQQRPTRVGGIGLEDLDQAPTFRERVPDEIPLDPEDMNNPNSSH